jgi:hypothetical protein
MISICTPTRARPEVFKQMCLSVLANSTESDDIEFVVYRDLDDISVYEYVGNYKEVRGKRLYADPAYTECYKVATGPIYMFMPDDIILETKGWDEKVRDVFSNFEDKIISVYLNNRSRSSFGIGCLHKNWIDTIGYFLSPDLCRRGDVWISQVAKNLGRRVNLAEVIYRDQNIVDDNTHAEYMTEYNRTKGYRRYHLMKDRRERDTKLLQDFIDNYGKVIT